MSTVNDRRVRRMGRVRASREGERAMRKAVEDILAQFAEMEERSAANRECIDVMREARGISPIEWSRDV